jgi:phage terminase large subunit
VFKNNEGGINFVIDSDLHEAIMDFEQTKEASDGRKDKKAERDPLTGVSFQRWGHISDLCEYLIVEAFKNEYQQFQRGNIQEVQRNFGHNPVNPNRL